MCRYIQIYVRSLGTQKLEIVVRESFDSDRNNNDHCFLIEIIGGQMMSRLAESAGSDIELLSGGGCGEIIPSMRVAPRPG